MRTVFALMTTLAIMTAPALQAQETAAARPSIVEIAANDARFSTLVTAIEAAGLVETLSSDGPFTVFAPTNAAFAKLPEGTLDELIRPENRSRLQAVLTYHVLPGKVMSSDIAGERLSPATVQGGTVDIDASDGVRVDGARVVIADIVASNGVIHAIDGVILPD